MSHEKCLKHVKTPCTSMAPSLVRVRMERGLPAARPAGGADGQGEAGPALVVRPGVAYGVGGVLCAAWVLELWNASLQGRPSQRSSGASCPAGSHSFPLVSPAPPLLPFFFGGGAGLVP